MPRAPRICAQPGCPNQATDRGRCPTHQRTPWEGSTRAARLPADWAKRRARILRRDRHQCQIKGPGCTWLATEVDHVNPGDDHREANLQAACHACNQAKALEEARAARAANRNEDARG